MSKFDSHIIWQWCAVLLLGAALRIAPLSDNRLHPDEALFATLGRLVAEGSDPLLVETQLLVDKPPLFYYTLAGGISMSWASELTARLPGLFASLISIALSGRLALTLWRSRTAGLIAGLFVALSPFAIAFSPTVFADPIMVMWLLGAFVAVSRGRWGWGGLLYGFALATKQNALLAAPLVAALGVAQGARIDLQWREVFSWAVRFGLGLGSLLALMAAWEIIRQPQYDFWTAGFEANNPGRLIRSGEVWRRANAWWRWAAYLAGCEASAAVLCAALGGLAIVEATRRHKRGAVVALILLSYVVAYAALLWLVAFPVLDRYLLILVPVVGLLVARAIQQFGLYFMLPVKTRIYDLLGGLLIAAMISPALQAAQSEIPVGGDHGAYDGIEEVAAYLRQLPDGTVIYYDTLGWTLDYYLFDSYLFLSPFASPDALEADLKAFGTCDEIRYLVLPGWRSHVEVLDAVEQAGFAAELVLETSNRFGERSFTVYHIVSHNAQLWRRAIWIDCIPF